MIVEDRTETTGTTAQLSRTPWIRALSLADLPIGYKLSNQVKQLGIQSVGDLIGFVEHDPVAYEDHTVLIEALRSAIYSDGVIAAIDAEGAWGALCDESHYLTLSEIANRRKCTTGSIIELANRAGVKGLDGQKPSLVYVVPEPGEINTETARMNIGQVEAQIKLGLPDREFNVLKSRYGATKTLQEIGDEMSLTRERVRQLETRAKDSLDGSCTLEVLLKALIPIHYAIESSGGATTILEISETLGSSPFPVSATLDMSPKPFALTGAYLVSKSGRHMPPSYVFRSSKRAVLLEHLDGLPEDLVAEAVGSTGVSRGSDFVRRVSENLAMPLMCKHSTLLEALTGFERQNLVTVSRVHHSEENEYGPWVTNAETPRSKQIVQAILKVGSDRAARESTSGTPGFFHAEIGVAVHLIIEHLHVYFGVRSSQGAVDELCKRFPDIFVRTGRTSWGLTGAGAKEAENVEQDKLGHGTTINLLVSVIGDAPGPLGMQEIIRRMRIVEPSIREQSVRLYLNNLHADRFIEKNGHYELSDLEKKRAATDLSFGTTIRILLEVMDNADQPLTENEIFELCQNILPVAKSALRGYLQQNYRGYFSKLDDGRFIRSDQA